MAEKRVQRRLAAILAADVVGYSRLMGADEEGTLARLKELRSELLHPKVSEYGGRIVKTTGDGTLIEFPSAVDAVSHAIDVQRSMSQRNSAEDPDNRIELRMGINVGDVIVDGEDIFGDGVNVAARLEAFAEPSGICISGTVYDQIRGKLHLPFKDLGEQSLKNIAEPVRIIAISLEAATTDTEATAAMDAIFRRPAVAVLPFENLSDDSGQDYFADGLTEDIITALSHWRSFPVIARNSSFAFKGQSPDIRLVGKELGARYIIEGSVRKSANRVRVTAQLINAETGHHVWADRYDRELEDIFGLQDEIAQRIAAIIEPELEKAERNRTAVRRPMNLDAWDCNQRGTSFLYEFTADGNARAREMFEQGIELDPSYSQAYTGLAYTHHRDLFLGFAVSRDESLEAFRQAARRAVALDETDSYAHWMLGMVYMWDRNFDLAVAQGEKSIELNPSNAISHIQLGVALTYAGKPAQGIPCIEKGMQLTPHDPRYYIYCTHLADAYLNADRYDEAIEMARTAIRQNTDYLEARLVRASALGYLGRVDEAKADLEECQRLNSDFAEPSAEWRGYRSPENIELLFDGLRKAGWRD